MEHMYSANVCVCVCVCVCVIIIRDVPRFPTRPDRPWGLSSLLYNGYRGSCPGGGGIKRPARGVDHPPPSSAEVKERIELYLYSPSGPSWPVLGWTLPLPLPRFAS
jgi:hypothetical protein